MYVNLYVCGFVACKALIELRKNKYISESKGVKEATFPTKSRRSSPDVHGRSLNIFAGGSVETLDGDGNPNGLG